MSPETIRELLRRQPFQPFRLILSNGESYEVPHPEMALLTRTNVLVGVGEVELGVPSEFRICSLPHVAAIEPLSGSAASR